MKKSSARAVRFAVCVTDTEPDLEIRKIYQVLPDRSAAKSNYVRIVDDSGEDYLYPASYFVTIDLPAEALRALVPTRPRGDRKKFRRVMAKVPDVEPEERDRL